MDNLVLRFILASLITFAPIFFANLIFSIVFRDQPIAEQVFGWNLIGSTLGGVLEYSSMALGYNRLTLIVALFYLLTFVCLMLAPRRVSPKANSLKLQTEGTWA